MGTCLQLPGASGSITEMPHQDTGAAPFTLEASTSQRAAQRGRGVAAALPAPTPSPGGGPAWALPVPPVCGSAHETVGARDSETGRAGSGKQTLASRRAGEGKTGFYDLWCCLHYSLVVAGKKLFSTTDARVGAPHSRLDLRQNTDPLTAPIYASTRRWARARLSSGAGTPHPHFHGDAGTGFGITLASLIATLIFRSAEALRVESLRLLRRSWGHE